MTIRQLIDRVQSLLNDPSSGIREDNEVFVGNSSTPTKAVAVVACGFVESRQDRAQLVIASNKDSMRPVTACCIDPNVEAVLWSQNDGSLHIEPIGRTLSTSREVLLAGEHRLSDYALLGILPDYEAALAYSSALEPKLRRARDRVLDRDAGKRR